MSQRLWGVSTRIDLHNCRHGLLVSQTVLRDYVQQLCDLIAMKRVGPTRVVRYGNPADGLEGLTAIQLIETSNITVHCDEQDDRVFVDIFSCKDYDAAKAAAFSKAYFKASDYVLGVDERK